MLNGAKNKTYGLSVRFQVKFLQVVVILVCSLEEMRENEREKRRESGKERRQLLLLQWRDCFALRVLRANAALRTVKKKATTNGVTIVCSDKHNTEERKRVKRKNPVCVYEREIKRIKQEKRLGMRVVDEEHEPSAVMAKKMKEKKERKVQTLQHNCSSFVGSKSHFLVRKGERESEKEQEKEKRKENWQVYPVIEVQGLFLF